MGRYDFFKGIFYIKKKGEKCDRYDFLRGFLLIVCGLTGVASECIGHYWSAI